VVPSVTRLEAVVFDLYGTLVPEFPLSRWDAMFAGMAAALDADLDAFRRAYEGTIVERQTGGFRDMTENVRAICERIDAQPSTEALERALEIRAAMYRDLFRPQPGAVETLGWLREHGYRAALVSMCAPDTPALWRASPLGGLVDVLVFSSEVGLRKPDPAIYLSASDGLGVDPTACLYVGDGSYRELTGAALVGMTPVRIVDPAEDGAVLRPDRDDWQGAEIRSLAEVPSLLPEQG
jgi:putative hydrolase of the HAD superfamily